jgi:hypothetical protein
MISARPAPDSRTRLALPVDRISSARSPDARPLLLGGLAVVLLYVVVYPLHGVHWAAGWDAPSYVVWARRAQAFGLSASNTGTRPGTVGLVATLSSLSGISAAGLAAALGPTLAACCGLGFAAFAELSLPAARHRAPLVTLLAGGFLSYMVLGYLATLVFLTALACALACLVAVARGRTGRRAGFAASILLAVAVLAHPALGPLALVLMAAAGLGPSLWRGGQRSRIRTAHWAWVRRVALIVAGAGVVAVVGLLLARAAPGPVLDRARDGALRRLGLPGLVTKSFQTALAGYLPYFVPAACSAIFAGAVIWKRRRSVTGSDIAYRVFWGVLLAWVATTLGCMVLLLIGLRVPGQRLAPVCLAVPVIVASGIALWNGDREWSRASRVIVAVPVLALVLVTNWILWETNIAAPPRYAVAAQSLGPILAAASPGTPLVVIVDQRGEGPGLAVIGEADAVRALVPPGRVQDVSVFVGTPQDFLAGRPTLTGSPEHDRLARDYWQRMKSRLGPGSLAVVVQAFDPRSYSEAAGLPGHLLLAPGVVALPGYSSPAPAAGERLPAALGAAGPGRFSPWLPVWLAAALLLLMVLVGWPWASWILPSRTAMVRLGLAPGLGVAAVALASVAVDAAGLGLGRGGGMAAVIVAFAVGAALATASHRRRKTNPSLS